MKKYLLTALIACVSYLASAQRTQHALGFHIGGSTIDLEYQYHMSEKNFLDFTVGVFNLDDGFLAQGTGTYSNGVIGLPTSLLGNSGAAWEPE